MAKKISAKEKLESQWITIFKAGKHTAADGKTYSFSEQDIDNIIANTDLETAANVIHHPEKTTYSFAKFSELKRFGKELKAKIKNSVQGFAESIQAGMFPSRSVRISNSKLEHLGWLPKDVEPAVKGMAAVQFSAPEKDVIEYNESNEDIDFSEVNGWELKSVIKDIASVLHSSRESIIEKDGIEAADKVIPLHRIDWIRNAELIKKEEKATITSYEEDDLVRKDEATGGNESGNPESKQDFEDVKIQLEAEREENRKLKKAGKMTALKEFMAPLEAAGKLTPAQTKNATLLFSAAVDGEISGKSIDFESVDKDGKKSVVSASFEESLKGLLSSLPVQVRIGKELVKNKDFSGSKAIDFSDDSAVNKAVTSYMNEKGCSYEEAFDHVLRRV